MEDLFSYFGFVVFMSVVEGLFWSRYRGAYKRFGAENPHLWLTLSRICVWAMFVPNWFLIVFMILSFSFVHDGVYYTTRHLIDSDKYPNHFFDVSHTSKAFLTLEFKWRLVLFVGSIYFLVISMQ